MLLPVPVNSHFCANQGAEVPGLARVYANVGISLRENFENRKFLKILSMIFNEYEFKIPCKCLILYLLLRNKKDAVNDEIGCSRGG
ncbi:hypothetical protein FHS90_001955 [Rufibacter quisquiliarum]|uniref:Uncharacterized protein n=1 Tax=Rufibacter quisquiliarum TaxID=1549639 RepID=A0A839GCD6_9BACT|nr:hypothetical protein [Rufibacter quisquiliarum]